MVIGPSCECSLIRVKHPPVDDCDRGQQWCCHQVSARPIRTRLSLASSQRVVRRIRARASPSIPIGNSLVLVLAPRMPTNTAPLLPERATVLCLHLVTIRGNGPGYTGLNCCHHHAELSSNDRGMGRVGKSTAARRRVFKLLRNIGRAAATLYCSAVGAVNVARFAVTPLALEWKTHRYTCERRIVSR